VSEGEIAEGKRETGRNGGDGCDAHDHSLGNLERRCSEERVSYA
jgi:hypothetical protein